MLEIPSVNFRVKAIGMANTSMIKDPPNPIIA